MIIRTPTVSICFREVSDPEKQPCVIVLTGEDYVEEG